MRILDNHYLFKILKNYLPMNNLYSKLLYESRALNRNWCLSNDWGIPALKRNIKSILADCALIAGIALTTTTDRIMADSIQPLPEVIEKESARMREIVIPGIPNKSSTSAVATPSKIESTKDNASQMKPNPLKEHSGQVLFSDESDIEVRGILEQVSKEKETAPGILSSGGPSGMPQAQPMYQPEGQ
jgi:hypothetical protein